MNGIREIDIQHRGKYDFVFGEPVSKYVLPNTLEILNIAHNHFSELPENIKDTRLRILKATTNSISELPLLPPTLEELHMGQNKLKERSFRRLVPHYTNLRVLKLHRNRLTKVPQLLCLDTLIELDLSHNFINSFDIPYPPQLVKFNVSHNRLQVIPDNIPETIMEFYIASNYIRELPPSIMNCQRLVQLNYENNRGIQITEEILAFIDRRMEARRVARARALGDGGRLPGHLEMRHTIYQDTQTVHASEITKSVKDNIEILHTQFLLDSTQHMQSLLTKYIDEFGKILDVKKNKMQRGWNWRTTNTTAQSKRRLTIICGRGGVHSILQMTIADIFVLVWHRIRRFEDKDVQYEIAKVIVGELPDLEEYCFTGRISRLVNVLTGFDENIRVEIDISSQIQAKYEVVKLWLEKHGVIADHPIYDRCFKLRFGSLLRELKLPDEVIDVWLDPFEVQPLVSGDLPRIKAICTKSEYASQLQEFNSL